MMVRLFAKLFIPIFILIVLGTTHTAHAQYSNKGKDFYVVFTENLDLYNSSHSFLIGIDPVALIFYITTDQDTTGEIIIPDYPDSPISTTINFSVTAGDFFTHKIEDTGDSTSLMNRFALADSTNLISKRAIRVRSQGDISVFSQIFQRRWSAVSLIFPNESLGSEYVIPSIISYNVNDGAEFSIVATEDDTIVEFVPIIDDITGQYFAGNTYSVTLDEGEVFTYFIQDNIDMSGTKIKALDCKKIAIYSGARYVQTFCDNTLGRVPNSGDNIFQQVIPIDSWGSEYIAVPSLNRAEDLVRIFGVRDSDTEVTINGQKVMLNSSNNYIYDYYLSGPVQIIGSQPIMVVQYQLTDSCDSVSGNSVIPYLGDPFMMILSPSNQRVNDVTFYSARAGTIVPTSNIVHHFTNVVIETAYKHTFKLNNQSYTNQFIDIPGTAYSYLRLDITSKVINTSPINYAEADVGFQITAYGSGFNESYGYLAGAQLDKINSLVYLFDEITQSRKTDIVYCSGESLSIVVESNNEVETIRVAHEGGNELANETATLWKTENNTYFYKLPVNEAWFSSSTLYTLAVNLEYKLNRFQNCYSNTSTLSLNVDYRKLTAKPFIDQALCAGTVVGFYDQSQVPVTNYTRTWNFGGGVQTTTYVPDYILRDFNLGQHIVTLTIADEKGCSNSSSTQFEFDNSSNKIYKNIYLFNETKKQLADTTTSCQNDEFSLIVNISSQTMLENLVWTFFPDNLSTTYTGTYSLQTNSIANQYTFSLGRFDFEREQSLFSITYSYDCNVINEVFTSSLNYAFLRADIERTSICLGTEYVLSSMITSTYPYTATWYFDTGIQTTSKDLSLKNISVQTHTYSLRIEDTLGCTFVETSSYYFTDFMSNIQRRIGLNNKGILKQNNIYCQNENVDVVFGVSKEVLAGQVTISVSNSNELYSSTIVSPTVSVQDAVYRYYNLNIPKSILITNTQHTITLIVEYDCNPMIDYYTDTLFYDNPKVSLTTEPYCLNTALVFSATTQSIFGFQSLSITTSSGQSTNTSRFVLYDEKQGNHTASVVFVDTGQCSAKTEASYYFNKDTSHILKNLSLYDEVNMQFESPGNIVCLDSAYSLVFGLHSSVLAQNITWHTTTQQTTTMITETVWRSIGDLHYYRAPLLNGQLVYGVNTFVANYAFHCNNLSDTVEQEYVIGFLSPSIALDDAICNGAIVHVEDKTLYNMGEQITERLWLLSNGLQTSLIDFYLHTTTQENNVITLMLTDSYNCSYSTSTTYRFIDFNTRQRNLSATIYNDITSNRIDITQPIFCSNESYTVRLSSPMEIETITVQIEGTSYKNEVIDANNIFVNSSNYSYSINLDINDYTSSLNTITYLVEFDCVLPPNPLKLFPRRSIINVVPTVIDSPCDTTVLTLVNNSMSSENMSSVIWNTPTKEYKNVNQVVLLTGVVGENMATLTIIDTTGCKESKDFRYVFRDFIYGGFTISNLGIVQNALNSRTNVICSNQYSYSYQLRTPSEVNTITWTFAGHRNIKSIQNPVYSYYDTGSRQYIYEYPFSTNDLPEKFMLDTTLVYTASYQVDNPPICISASETLSNKLIHAVLSPSIEKTEGVCELYKYIFEDVSYSNNQINNRTWTLDSGAVFTSSSFSISHDTNLLLGTHSLVLVVEDDINCLANKEVSFEIKPIDYMLDFSASGLQTCVVSPISAVVDPFCRAVKNPDSQYIWLFNGKVIGNDVLNVEVSNDRILLNQLNSITLKVLISEKEQYSKTKHFFVQHVVQSEFTIQAMDPSFCNNQTIEFINTSNTNLTITRVELKIFSDDDDKDYIISNDMPYDSNGKRTSQSVFFPRIPFFSKDVKYEVNQIIQTAEGCISTSTQQLVLHNIPRVELLVDKIAFCNTDSEVTNLIDGYVFSDKQGGYWEIKVNGLNFSEHITPQNYAPGDHTLQYTYVDPYCPATTDVIDLFIKRGPEVVFYDDTFFQTKEGSIEMEVIYPARGDYALYWSDNVSFNERLQITPKVEIEDNILFTVTIVAENGCSLVLNKTFRAYNKPLQNMLTLNSQGHNDILDFSELLEYFPDAELVIYTKGGIELARNKELKWDGFWENKAIPTDTYYYQIFLRNRRSEVVYGYFHVLSK